MKKIARLDILQFIFYALSIFYFVFYLVANELQYENLSVAYLIVGLCFRIIQKIEFKCQHSFNEGYLKALEKKSGDKRMKQENKELFIRACGDCICDECGKKYYDHPMAREEKWLSYDGHPFLNRLCDGTLVKL